MNSEEQGQNAWLFTWAAASNPHGRDVSPRRPRTARRAVPPSKPPSCLADSQLVAAIRIRLHCFFCPSKLAAYQEVPEGMLSGLFLPSLGHRRGMKRGLSAVSRHLLAVA